MSATRKKITPKTKAIIVQHTFGIPANMNQLVVFAKKHGLYLIEDCAHSLGATYQGKKVGSFGDAAFFSFGRDKVVSSVWGRGGSNESKEQRAKSKVKNISKQTSVSIASMDSTATAAPDRLLSHPCVVQLGSVVATLYHR